MKQFRDTCYYVCEDGTVISFARTSKGSVVGTGKTAGYYCVKPKGSNGWLVHQMVMECYGPPKPEGDYVIDHIDENKLNNNIDNLQWLGRSENVQKTLKTTRKTCVLTLEQADEIREKFVPWKYTRKMLAEEYGVSEGTVRDVLRNRYY